MIEMYVLGVKCFHDKPRAMGINSKSNIKIGQFRRHIKQHFVFTFLHILLGKSKM